MIIFSPLFFYFYPPLLLPRLIEASKIVYGNDFSQKQIMEESKMVTCELRGREFKNTQDLRGYKTYVYSSRSLSYTQATSVIMK